MKYQIYTPCSGIEYRIKLSKEFINNTSISIQYRYRSKTGNTPNPDNRISTTDDKELQNLYFHLQHQSNNNLIFNSRIALSKYSTINNIDTVGFLMYQEIIYTPVSLPLSIAARYTIFQADDYNSRIYTYERDLVYEFSTPAFYGKGSKFYILATFNISNRTSIGIKYSWLYYPEKTTINSNADMIEGNHKQEFKIQLRSNF